MSSPLIYDLFSRFQAAFGGRGGAVSLGLEPSEAQIDRLAPFAQGLALLAGLRPVGALSPPPTPPPPPPALGRPPTVFLYGEGVDAGPSPRRSDGWWDRQ